MSNLGDAVRGDLAATPPDSPASTALPEAHQPIARPGGLHEAARVFAPGAPAEAVGLALVLLGVVLLQQALGQVQLVVQVLGAGALGLLVLRLATRPRRPPPLRLPPPANVATSSSGVIMPGAGAGVGTAPPPAGASVDIAPAPVGTSGGAAPSPPPALVGAGPGPIVDASGAAEAVAAPAVPGRERAEGLLLGATPREWLIRAALLAGALVWVQMRGRPNDADYRGVVLIWLLSLVFAALAAAPAGLPAPRYWGGALRALPRADWLILGGLTLAALLLRVVWVNHVPYVFGGDEGSQALAGVDVLKGTLHNPFSTGWYSLPTLFFFLQAGSMSLFGQTVFGVRVVSAVIGALAVTFTYLLGRRLLGRTVAVAATVLLAVFHYHILFSRLASVQIGDSLLIVAALFFLDRAFVERRALDALAAGIVIGLSQYFSFAGRLIPLVGVAYVLYVALWDPTRLRPRLPRLPEAWRLAPQVGWIVLGAVLVYLPLLAHYADYPIEYTSRVDQVSMFTSGWLEHEQQTTGKGATALVLNQVWRAAMLPFNTVPGGWYTGIIPIEGLPMAIPFGIGLVLVTLGAWRRQYFGLAVAYWGTVLGLGLTEDPTQTQRFVIATPLMAMIAAIGLWAPLRLAAWIGDLPRLATRAALGVALVGLSAWNFGVVFLNPNPIAYYGTDNGLIATEMAYYLRALGPGYYVYFLGPPRMYFKGFSTVPFIAPDADGSNVEKPLEAGADPLPLKGPTIFAVLPERDADLEQVRGWYPDGELREWRSPKNLPLFYAYVVGSK
ncbi:MAG TPA: glycosyltransferase family 39 protein [Chloroflexota bacterium]